MDSLKAWRDYFHKHPVGQDSLDAQHVYLDWLHEQGLIPNDILAMSRKRLRRKSNRGQGNYGALYSRSMYPRLAGQPYLCLLPLSLQITGMPWTQRGSWLRAEYRIWLEHVRAHEGPAMLYVDHPSVLQYSPRWGNFVPLLNSVGAFKELTVFFEPAANQFVHPELGLDPEFHSDMAIVCWLNDTGSHIPYTVRRIWEGELSVWRRFGFGKLATSVYNCPFQTPEDFEFAFDFAPTSLQWLIVTTFDQDAREIICTPQSREKYSLRDVEDVIRIIPKADLIQYRDYPGVHGIPYLPFSRLWELAGNIIKTHEDVHVETETVEGR